MRIDILAIGSRGDVQPHVALGLGLQSAGYRVRLVTLGGFDELMAGHGLDHLAIGDSPQAIAQSALGRTWVDQRASTAGFLRGFAALADRLIEAGIANYWRACRDTEAVIASPMGLLVAVHAAERLRVPLIRTELVPRPDYRRRDHLAAAAFNRWSLLAAAAFRSLMWSRLRHATNTARRNTLGLPALPIAEPSRGLDRQRVPVLAGYSPTVVPRPPHWDDWIHVTGYWFLDAPAGWRPPDDLVDFLASGPPPVFVGFGSTPFPRPEATADLVVGALARAGVRGVVAAGGSGLPVGRLNDEVLSVAAVPHEWLFSQVPAVVHHGGAGVTAAVLRAGVPSVVIPVFGDQPFWGRRVFELEAGPRPIPARQLTAAALASAIRVTLGEKTRRHAAALSARIRAEDGVGRGIDVVDQYLRAPSRAWCRG